ncbi:hypothetical protein MMC10_006582 [Thelotrema lepadinum]|nr:hypothetical protein [Thelotrema lepadinum]
MNYVLSIFTLALLAIGQPIDQAMYISTTLSINPSNTSSTPTARRATPNNLGILPATPNGFVFSGTGGPYVNSLTNQSPSTILVVFWSVDNSFVANGNQPAPLAEITLSPGQTQSVSYSSGFAGAYAAIYPDTTATIANQIGNSWVEITTGESGVFDVSREVDMNGHPVSVSTNGCTSDLNTCVFECINGAQSCSRPGTYTLVNCAPGSQPGVTNNGGCAIGSGNSLATTFS